jgi:UDP-N-acetylglucosamine 4,6-dehydratase/5-epimerase
MGSRGSVIPLFVEQIKNRQPLTITDPAMTRFMMSIDGAVDLVLYAFEHAQPGDLYVQKAPAATIETLAQALLKVFHADNLLQLIGARHGEKKYETLLTREEMLHAIDQGDYYRVPADNRDLNYDAYFTQGEAPLPEEDYNSHNTRRLDVDEMAALLLSLDFIQAELQARK